MNDFSMFETGARIVVAVSGGVDSMVLLHRLKTERPDVTLIAVHVNHNMRDDSIEDEKTVQKACRDWNIPLHIHSIHPPTQGNLEDWGRTERYRLLKETCVLEEADWIATAHHLNDDIETLFLHLTRGTRLKGLCGISAHRKPIARPLLKRMKTELIEYAQMHQVPYRNDPTNEDTNLKRNAIRHEILKPMLEIFPHFPEQWLKLKEYLESLQNCLQIEAEAFLSQYRTANSIDKKAYSKLAYPIRAQILEEWHKQTTDEKIHHEDQIKRWDHAILFWENGKKTEWGQSPKPSFLIIEKTHVKIE